MVGNNDKDQTTGKVPRHVAVIMDGNGRWAKRRLMPRVAGHRAGVESVRKTVQYCASAGVEVLTLFAFSSENWHRPEQEVSLLMELFMTALKRETRKLHENGVRLQVIGDRSRFSEKLQKEIAEAESLTAANPGLRLVIAANYGGRWDISQAVRSIAESVEKGDIKAADVDEAMIAKRVCLSDLPEPDLFIRTSGEQRISNYLLWQLAYTELYFTDTLWPDFGEEELKAAFDVFSRRERRFGRTGEQAEKVQSA